MTSTTLPAIYLIDLWEAWIDLQCPGINASGTLFLVGNVPATGWAPEPVLVKKNVHDGPPHELALEISPDIAEEDDERYLQEVCYSESLVQANQYESIAIYAGKQLIARIHDIEILW